MYVEENIARKRRNASVRKVRLMRKVNLQKFNYFCTFTYDDKLHTEDSFKVKLRTCFRHLTERRGWKYIGVWERSPVMRRLHFHGLFYIPEGAMKGELTKVGDFSTKSQKWQITYQNEYFKCRFGRNDFQQLSEANDKYDSLNYMLKYIEKSGEKIVYSRGLPQFVISDILEDDVVCRYGQEDKKLLLFDDFTLINDGVVVGKATDKTIAQMPKSN